MRGELPRTLEALWCPSPAGDNKEGPSLRVTSPSRVPSLPCRLLPASSWFPGPGWFSGARKPKQGLHSSYLGRRRGQPAGTGSPGPGPAGGRPVRPTQSPLCQQHRGAFFLLFSGDRRALPGDHGAARPQGSFRSSLSHHTANPGLPPGGQCELAGKTSERATCFPAPA